MIRRTLFISSTFQPVNARRDQRNRRKLEDGKMITSTTSNIEPDESLLGILASLLSQVSGGEFEHRSPTT